MTFSHLYSSALDRELGNDDSTRLFTTGRRKDAINEGVQEFALQTRCFERRVAVTLTGGTAEYNLGSTSVLANGDFLELSPTPIEIRYTDSGGNVTVRAGQDLPHRSVAWLSRNEPNWQISTVASSVQQIPQVTYLRTGHGRQLGFWPIPSTASSASITATVFYYGQPPTLSADTQVPFTADSTLSTQGPSVTEPYHQAAAHYGAYQLEKLRRDHEASAFQYQQFLGYVTRYREAAEYSAGMQILTDKDYFADARGRETDDGFPPYPWRV